MKKKYLTEDKFEDFYKNDFRHLWDRVTFIRGQVWVVLLILAAVLAIAILQVV